MSKFKQLKKGEILSETSFYTVVSVNDTSAVLNLGGKEVTLGGKYIDTFLKSADFFTKEESLPVTELAKLVINNPMKAMSAHFTKKGEELTQKAYKQKVADAISKFENAKMSEFSALVNDMINNPITNTEPGKERTMKGYFPGGEMNSSGRINFFDMEANTMKQIDPRTLKFVILDGIKYNLKK